jgi:acetyltransferase-like isoleucine patch superfamily enzyme
MIPPSPPVVIAWIRSRVFILPDVRIGHDTVIGACWVVTRDIPPDCITVGNSARIVGSVAQHDGNQAQDPHTYCAH